MVGARPLHLAASKSSWDRRRYRTAQDGRSRWLCRHSRLPRIVVTR